MTMIALKPIRKGQEIFNDYGQLPRADLLRRYGYVTDNYKKWDVVEIDVQTVVSIAGAHINLQKSQMEARVSYMMLLNETTLSLLSFSSRTIGRCMKMAMTCNANLVVRLSHLTQLSWS